MISLVLRLDDDDSRSSDDKKKEVVIGSFARTYALIPISSVSHLDPRRTGGGARAGGTPQMLWAAHGPKRERERDLLLARSLA